MSRPALRITRQDAADGSARFAFEVWDPFAAVYTAQQSLDAALARVDALLERVRDMWMRADPAQTTLQDVPDPTASDDVEWAEFRASAQANRVHETRNFDQPQWRKATGGRQAAVETTCNEVGYRPKAAGP